MDWSSFLSGLIGAGFGSTFVGILLNLWIDHRLNIERKTLFDKMEFEQKRRESSKAIVDILSEWIHPKYMDSSSNEERWKLQKAYWTPLQLLDFQNSQTILSHFDGVFGVFISKLQLFDSFLPNFSHFRL